MPPLPSFAIIVLDKGFVYVGHFALLEGGWFTISKAQCVRRWGTESGLGQLASGGPRTETKLEPAPNIFAPLHALMHLIECNLESWKAHV